MVGPRLTCGDRGGPPLITPCAGPPRPPCGPLRPPRPSRSGRAGAPGRAPETLRHVADGDDRQPLLHVVRGSRAGPFRSLGRAISTVFLIAAAQRRQQFFPSTRRSPWQLPRKVTSPVMAMSLRHRDLGQPPTRSRSTIASPAEGASLGVAPSGTWTWISHLSKRGGLIPSCGEIDRT